jgi:hypothetical protein
MGGYVKDDRVEHVYTGSEGTVIVQDDATGKIEVNWDANEHGGYIGKHQPHEITPLGL